MLHWRSGNTLLPSCEVTRNRLWYPHLVLLRLARELFSSGAVYSTSDVSNVSEAATLGGDSFSIGAESGTLSYH